ncbi:hypothetical protein AB7M63_003624 [Bradyrhizobium japonicum]
MRTNKPFGITYAEMLPGQSASAPHGNFLEIDAKVRTFGNGRQLLEVPFAYVKDVFMPRHVHVKWSEADRLELIITAQYEIHVPSLAPPFRDLAYAKGKCSYNQPWDLEIGSRGVVLIAQPFTMVPPKTDDETTLDVTMEGTVAANKGGDPTPLVITKFRLGLRGSYTRSKEQFSGGASAGPVGVGYNPAVTSIVPKRYDAYYDFAIYALGIDLPPAEISLPPSVLHHVVVVEGGEGNTDIRGASLDPWVAKLEDDAPELHACIMAGDCPIKLTGHASDTGDEKKNRDVYAAKRILSAKEAILDRLFPDQLSRAGSRIVFESDPVGERDVSQSGPRPRERRVVITISRQKAEKAILGRRPKRP